MGVTWPRGPEPRQGLLRQRLLCPWLLSQGQTFPGLQGCHRAGEGRQVGAIPMPWSPTARGLASGSQSKGWELCQWRGRGTGWARPALPYTSCVALGWGPSCALRKSLCKGAGLGGGEAAIQAALVSCPLRRSGASSREHHAAVYSCGSLGHPVLSLSVLTCEMGRIVEPASQGCCENEKKQ